MRKIVLVHPQNDATYATPWIKENKCPPAGLLILARLIMDTFPDYQVHVIDSMDMKKMFRAIQDAEVVGATSIYTNHQSCLTLLQEAKNLGAITWVGGMNATVLAKQILKKRPFIDYVFLGDAENAVCSLLNGNSADTIPNLAYRNSQGSPRLNAIKPIQPRTIFNLIPLIGEKNVDRSAAFNISSIRGCVKAAKGRCSFCSLQHKHLTLMEPQLVWQQIDMLVGAGFHFFEESGDCFYVGDYPLRLLLSRPSHLEHVRFKVYMRPEQINRATLEVLKQLNVVEVFMGMDSLDDSVLRQANRGCTEKDILSAINLLAEHGFGLHLPFIWGLPGTTKTTLSKTLAFAREVKSIFDMQRLEFLSSLAVPIVGSSLFATLANNEKVIRLYPGNLAEEDIIDYATLIKLQTDLFTSVSQAEVNEAMGEIYTLHHRTGGFGV